MDNVQKCDSYINIPSSQTYRSHSIRIFSWPEKTPHVVISNDCPFISFDAILPT
jgi:hypothetical protein